MYIKRFLEDVVINVSKSFPVVLITGPRQVGKTTMLSKIADEKRTYVTLDSPANRELAKNDPESFLERFPPPVIIDEIQYAPELFPFIKIYVDTHQKNGDFWCTGSQMFVMMKNVSESLAGRVAVLQMHGLSNSEIKENPYKVFEVNKDSFLEKINFFQKESQNYIFENIFSGSMPKSKYENFNHEIFYSSYVNTYLERDVQQLNDVKDLLIFYKFMVSLAARTSQVLNYSHIAKDLGISVPTIKKWVSILVTSGIIYLLEPYYNNLLNRVIKSPKIYFLDTGLCAYLTNWNNSKNLELSAMAGPFFETYVISEILKNYYNKGSRPPLFYYRDSNGKEIDLIIESNGTLFPIEIKKSSNPKKETLKHFSVLEKTNKLIGLGCVICLASDLLPIDKNNWQVPVWLI